VYIEDVKEIVIAGKRTRTVVRVPECKRCL